MYNIPNARPLWERGVAVVRGIGGGGDMASKGHGGVGASGPGGIDEICALGLGAVKVHWTRLH